MYHYIEKLSKLTKSQHFQLIYKVIRSHKLFYIQCCSLSSTTGLKKPQHLHSTSHLYFLDFSQDSHFAWVVIYPYIKYFLNDNFDFS